MAKELDIDKCWFHKNHYDIPKKRTEEIQKRCTIVSSEEIVNIIKEQLTKEVDQLILKFPII
jgi:hypothetical protein